LPFRFDSLLTFDGRALRVLAAAQTETGKSYRANFGMLLLQSKGD
jgi:hypothetical protein